MKGIDPLTFWDFLKSLLVNDYKNDPEKIKRYYRNRKPWTKHLTDLIVRNAKCFEGIEAVDQEFFARVDISLFDKCTSSNWDEWSYEVAIELENDPNDWRHECHKLMLLNCGLKVLIAYRYKTLQDLQAAVNEIKDIYESRKYHRKGDQWLLIFGPMECDNEKDRSFIVYKMTNSGDDTPSLKISRIDTFDLFAQ